MSNNYPTLLIAMFFSWLYCWLCFALFDTGSAPLQAAGFVALLVAVVGVLKEAIKR
ncbi:hypothetical protein [Ktedonospora formicarum]|uniref:Uncharacterized protein n=1 Tax=Ktedonospora formicarum TaxID=2778364 RepID=A0A8J3MSS0_9CHLR|nr:hypothetical protein [Ktedonospora formicarum]GHO45146.1 hypothetical protein KSX_33090 [Ktedonospora formicarum]